MSKEYLSNISDVGDIFQESMMTCLELSSQIKNLVSQTRDLSKNEVKNLLDMEKRSARTLKRMESHWKRLVRKARTGEDTMVFSELDSLVQMALFAIEQAHTPYRTGRFRENSLDMVTPSEPGDSTDSTPEDDEDKKCGPSHPEWYP